MVEAVVVEFESRSVNLATGAAAMDWGFGGGDAGGGGGDDAEAGEVWVALGSL